MTWYLLCKTISRVLKTVWSTDKALSFLAEVNMRCLLLWISVASCFQMLRTSFIAIKHNKHWLVRHAIVFIDASLWMTGWGDSIWWQEQCFSHSCTRTEAALLSSLTVGNGIPICPRTCCRPTLHAATHSMRSTTSASLLVSRLVTPKQMVWRKNINMNEHTLCVAPLLKLWLFWMRTYFKHCWCGERTGDAHAGLWRHSPT